MFIESIFLIITSVVITLFVISSLFFSKNTMGVIFICCFAIIANAGLYYFYKGLTGHPRHASEMSSMFYPYEDEEVEVMQFYLVPNEEIFLITKELDSNAFMLISIPWDEELAQALYEAKEDNKKNGTQTKIKFSKKGTENKGQGDGKQVAGKNKDPASGENSQDSAVSDKMTEDEDKKGSTSEEEGGANNKKYDKNNIQVEVYQSFTLKE